MPHILSRPLSYCMLLIDILIRRLVRIFRGGVFQTYGHSLGTVSTIFRSKIEKLCHTVLQSQRGKIFKFNLNSPFNWKASSFSNMEKLIKDYAMAGDESSSDESNSNESADSDESFDDSDYKPSRRRVIKAASVHATPFPIDKVEGEVPKSQKTKVRKADNGVCLIERVSLENAFEYCHVIGHEEEDCIVSTRILSCHAFGLSSSAGRPRIYLGFESLHLEPAYPV